MKLSQIFAGIEFNSKNFREQEIRGISLNSNQVQPGYIFVALKGVAQDGHDFIYQAIERGASAVVVNQRSFEELFFSSRVTIIEVADTREALPKIAANFYGNPVRFLKLIGITGTNGKTTVSFLLERMFRDAKMSSGVIGTICYKIGNREIPASNTTPDPLLIQKFIREMVDLGQDLLILEASSHGLKQGRLAGLSFDCAIYTNLGEEHLDYHSDMEDYYQSKKILFSKLLKEEGLAVINIDDAYGSRLWNEISKPRVSYGFSPQADVRVLEFKMSLRGMHLLISAFGKEMEVSTLIFGRHNVYNLLASIAVGLKFGIEEEDILSSLEGFSGISGRLEQVPGSSQIKVFVDYAHTPEALREVLSTLSQLKKGKLWVVFGCGGNRYREKRPLMGEIASVLADKVILTSDNPREEVPIEIIQEILQGVKYPQKCWILPDRKTAIEKAVASAEPADVILIAGKGHERYQIMGNLIIPFDDKEIASKALTKRTMKEMANVF